MIEQIKGDINVKKEIIQSEKEIKMKNEAVEKEEFLLTNNNVNQIKNLVEKGKKLLKKENYSDKDYVDQYKNDKRPKNFIIFDQKDFRKTMPIWQNYDWL